MRLFHIGLANDPQARTMVDDHRAAIVAMMAQRFPYLDLMPGGSPRRHAQAVLMLARIDHFASAAAEEQPRIAQKAGLDIGSDEIAQLLSSRLPPQRDYGRTRTRPHQFTPKQNEQ